MRTNLDFSTRQLADPTAGFQQNIHQLGTLFGQFQKNKLDAEDRAQRIKERQQDVEFRNQQALRAEEQFNKSFGLQEAQGKRAQQDQERKLLGEQRLGEYADRLSGGLARGEMSDIQAAKVNMDIDRMLSNGMTPEQVNTKLLSKEYAPNLAYTAPKSTADKLAYIKSAGFSSPDYDATKLLDYQQKLTSPLEQQLRDEERMTNEWKLAKMREAGENARLNKRLAAEKEAKPAVLTMTKILPDGRVQEVEVRTEQDAAMYRAAGYTPGKITGSYKPDTKDGDTGTPVVPLRTGTGSWDDARLSKLATTLQTAGLSGKDAVGLANLATEDKWYGTGVNFNKVLDPVYEKLRKKDPNITRPDVANMINTAFD